VQATATPPQNLPATADVGEGVPASGFAVAGQLALPGAVAQLGLDGAAYSPRVDLSPEGANLSLGPHTDFCTAGDLPPAHHSAAPDAWPTPAQLALALPTGWEDPKKTPQLTVWERLDVVRDLVRGGEWDRDAKCNRVRFEKSSDVEINRSDRGKYSTSGTIKCEQWQTCPHCGPKLCHKVASQLAVLFNHHLAANAEHDVWMLSLTIPHYADVSTETVVDQLYAAGETFMRSKQWRRFVKRWGVIGRVRVLDATHGSANGSHPHFHIAIFVERSNILIEHAYVLRAAATKPGQAFDLAELDTDRERWGFVKPLRACPETVRRAFLDEIMGTLREAWDGAVRDSGARIESPEDFHRKGVELTPSENAASYFTKWGLADEVAASASKSKNHLRLLDAVAFGVRGAAYTWKQWRRAVHQHALVTGLGAIVRKLGRGETIEADAAAWLDEQRRRREKELADAGTPVVLVPALSLKVRSHLYGAAMHLGWPAVFAFVDKTSEDYRLPLFAMAADVPQGVREHQRTRHVQQALDDFLWSHLPFTYSSDSG